MNVYSYSILCCFVFLSIISYQDFRKLKIKADVFFIFLPVATIHWLIMNGLSFDKAIDLVLIIVCGFIYFIFYKNYKAMDIGAADILGLIWLTLFLGYKNSLFIYLASILLFILIGGILLLLTKKSIKTKMSFMPCVWMAFCLFFIKGWL